MVCERSCRRACRATSCECQAADQALKTAKMQQRAGVANGVAASSLAADLLALRGTGGCARKRASSAKLCVLSSLYWCMLYCCMSTFAPLQGRRFAETAIDYVATAQTWSADGLRKRPEDDHDNEISE